MFWQQEDSDTPLQCCTVRQSPYCLVLLLLALLLLTPVCKLLNTWPLLCAGGRRPQQTVSFQSPLAEPHAISTTGHCSNTSCSSNTSSITQQRQSKRHTQQQRPWQRVLLLPQAGSLHQVPHSNSSSSRTAAALTPARLLKQCQLGCIAKVRLGMSFHALFSPKGTQARAALPCLVPRLSTLLCGTATCPVMVSGWPSTMGCSTCVSSSSLSQTLGEACMNESP